MKTIINKYTLFSLFSSIILFSGCSTKEATVAVSNAHLYNNNYGVVSDPEADMIIAQEIASQNEPTEIDYSNLDPRYTTKIEKDPDAFLASEWVQPEPKVFYKYMDDPKFYAEDELPENKFRTGHTIIKIPNNRTMVSR
ncbi:MAG: hypothetical protein GXO60_07915 [Epsilonproteobacteria bacterium]|nr:hypothetical protein [Campylobacterota bacterium]